MKKFEQFLSDKQVHLVESGVARVRRMLWGNVPVVNSVGIITANNPNGRAPLPKGTIRQNRVENERLNAQLMDDLRAHNFGPIKCKGKFGGWENSYIVPNVKRDELIALGRKYNQAAVIWGGRATDENGHPFFKFQYIEGDRTVNTRDVHIGNEDVQGRDDLFTMIKQRKFVIPFFDDKYAQHKPGEQYGTVKPPEQQALSPDAVPAIPPAGDLAKAEAFFIPFFDEPDADVELFEGRQPTYFEDMLQHDPVAMLMVAEVHRCEGELAKEGYVPKHYWMYRGILSDQLSKLAKHLT